MAKDVELEEFLRGVVGVVEATNYEKMCLYREYSQRGNAWKSSSSGIGRAVGRVGDAPVFVSLWVDEVQGHRILFLEATSRVVDHGLIDDWLQKNLPMEALERNRDGPDRVRKVDAMNFHNVFPREYIEAKVAA